ncbi:MAG TPA: GDP-L-fucose synthase [Alphaproteobacteria bacterium]
MTATSDKILFPLAGKRIWVAGHRGMVGSAIVRRLRQSDCEILTADRRTLDLTRQKDVEDWVAAQRPDAAVIAAAEVGGIHANNSRPADFIYDNLAIEIATIQAAKLAGVKKLLFLGSSCIYPRLAPQPMKEETLLTGPLEPTNQWYAIAKIAGLKMCQAYRRQHGCDFISAMPTNLYGPGDNFDPQESHVPAAMVLKTHRAKMANAPAIEVWGTGTPRREFLFVDDLAEACVFLMERYSDEETVNVGTGTDVTIRELAEIVARVVGYRGDFTFNTSKPDGAPQKLLDVGRLAALGWRAKTGLDEGFARTYEWFLQNVASKAA